MKNRSSIRLITLVLMLFSTACTGLSSPAQDSSHTSHTHAEADNFQEERIEGGAEISISAHVAETSSASARTLTYKGFNSNNISGKIKNVYYGGGPNVLVTTSNTLYLYDLSRDAIAAETKTISSERGYRAEHYKPIKNGFVGLLLDLNR